MKESNTLICLKLPPCCLPDIWMQPLLCHLHAEVVAVPVVDGVKTKTRMNVTGQSVVQKWQNGSVSPLSVTEADSISFITIQHYA